MEKLRERHGVATTLRALRFLATRLKSRPETAHLVGPVLEARAQLLNANDVWEQAMEERAAQSSEIAYLDSCLENEVNDLTIEARAMCGGRTDDPRYQRILPRPQRDAGPVVGSEHQERFVMAMISRIVEDAELVPLRSRAAALRQRLEALSVALKRREELYLPEMKAATERRIALDRAQHTYNFLHPQLMMLLDEELVESFFPVLRCPSQAPETVGGTGEPSDMDHPR